MKGKGKFLAVALPLLLAACGQEAKPTATEPAAAPVAVVAPSPEEQPVEMTGGKTLAETLAEPGWVETSKGFWERDSVEGHESVYMGPEGAKAALEQRQRWQANMLKTVPAAKRSEMQANFAEENAALMRAASLAPSQDSGMQAQAFNECSHSESIQRLTSGPGIKATAWMQCNRTGLYPNAAGDVSSNYGSKQALPNRTATSATAQVSIGGTSNCNAYIFTEAVDFWGYTYGKQRGGYGCYGVTYTF